jgi:hypothetical protein
MDLVLNNLYKQFLAAIQGGKELPYHEVHITGGRQSGKSYFGDKLIFDLKNKFGGIVESVLVRMFLQDKYEVARDFAFKMTKEGVKFTYYNGPTRNYEEKTIGIVGKQEPLIY